MIHTTKHSYMQTQHKDEMIEEKEEETEEDLSLLLTKRVVVDVVVPFVDLSAVMFDHKYRIALDRFGAQGIWTHHSALSRSSKTNCSEWALRASIESFRISRCDTPRLDLTNLAAMKMLIRSPGFDEDGKILKRRRGKIRISVARIAFETPPKLLSSTLPKFLNSQFCNSLNTLVDTIYRFDLTTVEQTVSLMPKMFVAFMGLVEGEDAKGWAIRVRWCSSAERENSNTFTFSCFYYGTQITRMSLVLIPQENHSKINARVYTRL